MAFVQADPIRAPARAQDLTLRPRVRGYRAGDLDANYASLPVEEDFFINYGFVTKDLQRLMHPRASVSPTGANKRAKAILEFVRERGTVHPREVDAHFAHGTVTNYWGGSSSATTHLLEAMHYKGMVRVARRENGIRIYATQEHGEGPGTAAERRASLDALVDAVVGLYAPVPAASLTFIISRLRYATPHWRGEIKSAIERAKKRFAHAIVDGHTWYWPEMGDRVRGAGVRGARVRIAFVCLRRSIPSCGIGGDSKCCGTGRIDSRPTPRRRNASTVITRLPLLWRDRVIGWANVTMQEGVVDADVSYVSGRAPRDRGFKTALEQELDAMQVFLSPRVSAR